MSENKDSFRDPNDGLLTENYRSQIFRGTKVLSNNSVEENRLSQKEKSTNQLKNNVESPTGGWELD